MTDSAVIGLSIGLSIGGFIFICCFAYAIFQYCGIDGCVCGEDAKDKQPHKHTILFPNSLRGGLVRVYKNDITDHYYLDTNNTIGKGGCGVVVIGEQKETHSQYAVKIVNKNNAERGRLDREIKLLKDVDHSNIVRLFRVYDVPGKMYFVMELCLGGHLGQLVSRQPNKYLDEQWAKKLCRQLLSAMAHMHNRGIAHRDIKLQNILLDVTDDHQAQLKLIDFGYGSRFKGALPMRTKCGTPYTTAPEVIRESYDERCDVWSCGVVLFIMLCGRRPFEVLEVKGELAEAGKAAMITNILAGRYSFNHPTWNMVSKAGIGFVKALLHPDYTKRMHSFEALEHPWLQDTAIFKSHSSVLQSTQSMQAVEIMKRNTEGTDLHRTGMVALVFGIEPKVSSDMRSLFQSFDKDASGTLSREEFHQAMSTISEDLTPPDIDRLFGLIDIDKNEQISYTEFLAATLDPRDVDLEELSKAFKLLDENDDGVITREELYKVLKMQYDQIVTNHQIHQTQVLNSNFNRMESIKKYNFLSTNDSLNNNINRSLSGKSPSAFNRSISIGGVGVGIARTESSISKVSFANNSNNNTVSPFKNDPFPLPYDVDAKVDELFSQVDINNDGVISYGEFLFAMTGVDFYLSTVLPSQPISQNTSARNSPSILAENNELRINTNVGNGISTASSHKTESLHRGLMEKEQEPPNRSSPSTPVRMHNYSRDLAQEKSFVTITRDKERVRSRSNSPTVGFTGPRVIKSSANELLALSINTNSKVELNSQGLNHFSPISTSPVGSPQGLHSPMRPVPTQHTVTAPVAFTGILDHRIPKEKMEFEYKQKPTISADVNASPRGGMNNGVNGLQSTPTTGSSQLAFYQEQQHITTGVSQSDDLEEGYSKMSLTSVKLNNRNRISLTKNIKNDINNSNNNNGGYVNKQFNSSMMKVSDIDTDMDHLANNEYEQNHKNDQLHADDKPTKINYQKFDCSIEQETNLKKDTNNNSRARSYVLNSTTQDPSYSRTVGETAPPYELNNQTYAESNLSFAEMSNQNMAPIPEIIPPQIGRLGSKLSMSSLLGSRSQSNSNMSVNSSRSYINKMTQQLAVRDFSEEEINVPSSPHSHHTNANASHKRPRGYLNGKRIQTQLSRIMSMGSVVSSRDLNSAISSRDLNYNNNINNNLNEYNEVDQIV
eukprot:gene5845-8065_t